MTDDQVKALLDGATPGPFSCQTFEVAGYVYGPEGNLIAEVFGAIGGTALANTHLFNAAPDLARALLKAHAELEALRKERDDARAERDELDFLLHEGGEDSVANLIADRDRLAAAHAQIEALRVAIAYVLDGYGLNAPDFKRQPEDDEDDWIVTHLRAALAALSVPNFSAGWPLEEDDGSIIVGAALPAKEGE